MIDEKATLPVGLSAREVAARLRHAADAIGHHKYVLAFYLADMDHRRLYQLTGHGSTIHFGETQLEMDARRTREYVQVGRTLRELALVESEPLCVMIHHLGKVSDNFIAETLLKTLAAEHRAPGAPGGPATWQQGLGVVQRFLVDDVGVLPTLHPSGSRFVIGQRETPLGLRATHRAPCAVTARHERLRVALAPHDVGPRAHAAGDNAKLTVAGRHCALARDDHVLAEVVLPRNVVVVTPDRLGVHLEGAHALP